MRRLFIISDLHLGGRPDVRDQQGRITKPGYQICHAHAELVAFIRWIATQGEGDRPADLEVVINGDLVDFLADDDWDGPDRWAQVWTTDEGQAVRKLEHIVKRVRIGPQEGVFEALRDFLAAGHRLTLMLGNHDVELSLPAVRRRLAALLGGDNARLQFIYDGEAYVVGTVLIEHGNRYDHWNMINYSALRQERSMQSRRLPVRKEHRKDRYFVEPAGTHLVIHFMNLIKGRYRFIDLLKPETNAVIPLLLALEPSYRPHLADLVRAAPIALKTLKQRVRSAHIGATLPRHAGEMADWIEDPTRIPGASGGDWSSPVEPPGVGGMFDTGPAPTPAGPGTPPDEALDLRENFVPDMDASLDRVLAETLGSEALYFPAVVGKDLSDREGGGTGVDWLKARFDSLAETVESATRYFSLVTTRTDEQRLRQLHAALRHLNCNDHSFDLGRELPEYTEAAREMTQLGGFEVVTFGHTHLPKEISFSAGGEGPPWYFNTGTWCDVMQLPPGIAAEYSAARAELEAFLKALRGNDFSQYVRRYLTFLEIELEPDERVRTATLYSYGGPGRERSKPLTNYYQPPQGG
jgi:UDP-2,3-diacylglucosamine pyrophosphatase LpxH